VRLRFKPQRSEFFELFSQAAQNTVEITGLLKELLSAYPGDGRELISEIKEREHEGDRLTTQLIGLLNRTFVTPFDRDDIFRLATSIDDICDLVDEAASNVELYDVRRIPERAREQADVINRAAEQLETGVSRLEGFRDASDELRHLRELEDEGDRLVGQAVAELFRSGQDAISIIRWKDIHEQLEEAVDAFQTAADILEAILVKNR
jgi:predicted phosphate transport protein (TIGR00153 family)